MTPAKQRKLAHKARKRKGREQHSTEYTARTKAKEPRRFPRRVPDPPMAGMEMAVLAAMPGATTIGRRPSPAREG